MIHILTTGGSIDKVYSPVVSDLVIGEPQIARILNEAYANLEVVVDQLFRKDSLEITDEDRALIHEKVRTSPHRQIVISHGTDTLTLTARALMDIPDKVIVLTGAMQPAAFKQSDAAFNIGCALGAVQALSPGVYVVMSGRIFHPEKTRKNVLTNQFESVE
ncbi:MAG: asparaginase domain-containing protein [Anaerolineae bacterium]